MIVRALALSAGLAGAAGLSQFPEFSQQYRQRLGGAVDELQHVVTGFDRDAAGVWLDRGAALAQLETGGAFGAARARSMRATIDRHARLRADLRAIETAGPFMRARLAARVADARIARRTWQNYAPALPLTFEGLVFGAAGFVVFGGAAGLVGRACRRALRLGRRATP